MNVLADIILGLRSGATVADGRVSLSDTHLISEATSRAAAIRRVASRPAPLVAVNLPLSVDSIVHLLASIIGNYSVCFTDPSADASRRKAVLNSVSPDVVVDIDGVAEGWDVRQREREHGPGYVAMSSGSTGDRPKGVLSSWESIAAFAPFGADALELDRTGVWVELTHPAYDMAMTNLLIALASGASLRVSSTLGDQLRPLRFAGRVGGTHLRLAPRFVDLAASERQPATERSIRVWGSGGDRLPEQSVRRVFSFGIPRVVNTYGMSETAGFASVATFRPDEPVPSHRGLATIGAGHVGPWTTRLVRRDEQSMLTIHSTHMPAGYLFGGGQGYPRWEGNQTVLTGDIGVSDGDQIFCVGRSGRRVKRNGRFVDLDEIDVVVFKIAGHHAFTVATTDGDLRTLVETADTELDRLRQELRSLLRAEILPDELIAVKQLPRLGNGKVDHSRAASLAELDAP